ncbi:MAG: hypothetical protein ACLTZM_13650 [Ruminococcus sp.]
MCVTICGRFCPIEEA